MPSELGSHIRETRQKAGIGLRELARRVAKSPAYLVLLERAETPPGITEDTLKSIAMELGLNADLLMALASKLPAALLPRSPLEVELYRFVGKLSIQRQEALLKALRAEFPHLENEIEGAEVEDDE